MPAQRSLALRQIELIEIVGLVSDSARKVSKKYTARLFSEPGAILLLHTCAIPAQSAGHVDHCNRNWKRAPDQGPHAKRSPVGQPRQFDIALELPDFRIRGGDRTRGKHRGQA